MLVDGPSYPPEEGGGDSRRDPFAACAKAARGALSANTERAVRSDLAIYCAWCTERCLPALPASTETIAAFVDAMAKVRAPATVRRYIASIAGAHRGIGKKETTASEPVRLALQRMHREHGRRQAQAKGLTEGLRNRLLKATGDRLVDARNCALLAVAYDTLLRRAELVAVQVVDIVEEIDGAATVLVRRSKGDPEGEGAMAYVAPDSMALVREWLKEAASARAGSSDRCPGGSSATDSARARSRGSSREWRAMPTCPWRWSSKYPGTAPGWARRRTWSRAVLPCRPS